MSIAQARTDTSEIADEALLQRYAQGDFGAFEQLYQRHKGGLYRYFLRQLGNTSLAEDLFQDIWGKVISQAAQYQPTAKFSTWLYTLAQHKLIDHVRHLKVVDKVIDSDSQAEDVSGWGAVELQAMAPEQLYQQDHAKQVLKYCIAKLPLVQRECFLLKEEAGLSLEAIAEVVSANYEACKSRLRYACDNLRQCIQRKLSREEVV